MNTSTSSSSSSSTTTTTTANNEPAQTFATTTTTSSGPMLPPLYFQDKQTSLKQISTNSIESMVPPEILHCCISEYCDWGDLARLSSVQSSWKTIVSDAASFGGRSSKWELASSLMEGTHGMAENPALAVTYFTELAGVNIHQIPDKEEEDEEEGNGESSMENEEQTEDEATTAPPTTADTETAENRNKIETYHTTAFAPAMRKLATCYLTGNGVEQNSALGLRWLRAAHHCASDLDAAFEIAALYEYGQCHVPIDVVLAAKWFRHAATAGHIEAMAEYALCCELGCGVEQDDATALEWYTKAAEAGHVGAKFSVGEAFEEARGVPQSDEEACLWYYKAAVDGDEDSKKALRRLRDIARIVLPGVVGSLLDA